MNNFAHIGKNDPIGYSLIKQGYNVFSHSDRHQLGTSVSHLSISAFDPIRKNNISSKSFLIESVCNIFPATTKILYFSSLRQLEFDTKYANYRINKKLDIDLLRKHFNNLSVCYLPNLVCSYNKYESRFLSMLRKNNEKNKLKFDLNMNSSWNFIMSDEIAYYYEKMFKQKEFSLLSSDNTTLGQISDYLQTRNPNISIVVENEEKSYPEVMPEKIIYARKNLGANANWLKEII